MLKINFEAMIDKVKEILKEYCEGKNTTFDMVKPKLLNLFSVINRESEVKSIFIDTMLVCRENGWTDSQKDIRYTYGGYSIINVIEDKE